MEADKKFNQASEIVEAKLDFYKSLVAFVFIVSALVAYDIYTSGQMTWSKWVIFGWGFGLIIQGHRAFIENGVFGTKLRDKMIKKELRKL